MLLLWFVLGVQLKHLHNGASKQDPLPHEREEKPPERRRAYALLGYFSQTLEKARGFSKRSLGGKRIRGRPSWEGPTQCKQHPSFASPSWLQSALHRAGRKEETRVDGVKGVRVEWGRWPSSLPGLCFSRTRCHRQFWAPHGPVVWRPALFLPCSSEACSWDPFCAMGMIRKSCPVAGCSHPKCAVLSAKCPFLAVQQSSFGLAIPALRF